MHDYARDAAAAALAAFEMGKFMEFQEALYENSYQLGDEKIREIAADLGLDPGKFEQLMKSEKIRKKIELDMIEAEKVGANGTPTIFINGRRLRDRSIEGFQNVIDTLLKKKQ